MQQSHDQIVALVNDLGLKPGAENRFFGRIEGFPVGLEVVFNPNALGLLFHIRHPSPALAVEGSTGLKELIALKEAEFDVDDNIAWLNFFVADRLVQNNILLPLLLDTLSRMKQAGICPQTQCQKCQAEMADELQFDNGRVHQVCPACLAQANRAVTLDPLNLPFILSWGSLGAFAGAIIWATLWIGYLKLLDSMNLTRIFIYLFVLPCVGIGFLTALPVGRLLKKIPRRGYRMAGWIGGAFALAAAIVGEGFFTVYEIYKVFGVISFEAAFRFLPQIVGTYDFMLWSGKLTALACAAGAAYDATRPKKKL